MKEGLDRHEAVHAMGSVLSEKLFVVMSEQDAKGDLNADYVEKLKSLTAESWRRGLGRPGCTTCSNRTCGSS